MWDTRIVEGRSIMREDSLILADLVEIRRFAARAAIHKIILEKKFKQGAQNVCIGYSRNGVCVYNMISRQLYWSQEIEGAESGEDVRQWLNLDRISKVHKVPVIQLPRLG
jgi:hypothetical protein